MEKITIITPDKKVLEEMRVASWPVWKKEISRFDWFYDEKEIFYFLEGEVILEYENNKKAYFKKGDMVIFQKGLKCVWDIKAPVKKHYKFGD